MEGRNTALIPPPCLDVASADDAGHGGETRLADEFPEAICFGGEETPLVWLDADAMASYLAQCPEKEFFARVLLVMKDISRVVEVLAQDVLAHSCSVRKWYLPTGGFLKNVARHLRDRNGDRAHQEIVAKVGFLEVYCDANARALQELMWRHDATVGGNAGAIFYAACQRSAIKHAKFVTSTEVIEARSILALHKLYLRQEPEPAVAGDYKELMCAICLDLMHKPVALGCGHCLCHDCALIAAGCRRYEKLSEDAPRGACCPICRRQGVFRTARPLPETAHLAQERFPRSFRRRSLEKPPPESELELKFAMMCRNMPGSEGHGKEGDKRPALVDLVIA